MNYKTAKLRYAQQKSHCGSGGKLDKLGHIVEMRLTFEEWADIWEQSGHWVDRGIHKGSYCMARNNDIGHYEVGNVSIQLTSLNTKHGNTGLKRTAEQKLHISNCNKGRKHTPEALAKISAAQIGGKRSAETRAKMSASATGVKCSEETKLKLSKLNKGKKMKRGNCKYCGFETSMQNLSRHERSCKDDSTK